VTAIETARVRIDEQAPRVLALMESPQWPPWWTGIARRCHLPTRFACSIEFDSGFSRSRCR